MASHLPNEQFLMFRTRRFSTGGGFVGTKLSVNEDREVAIPGQILFPAEGVLGTRFALREGEWKKFYLVKWVHASMLPTWEVEENVPEQMRSVRLSSRIYTQEKVKVKQMEEFIRRSNYFQKNYFQFPKNCFQYGCHLCFLW